LKKFIASIAVILALASTSQAQYFSQQTTTVIAQPQVQMFAAAPTCGGGVVANFAPAFSGYAAGGCGVNGLAFNSLAVNPYFGGFGFNTVGFRGGFFGSRVGFGGIGFGGIGVGFRGVGFGGGRFFVGGRRR